MIKTTAEFPIPKKELKERFGFLSFQTIFINMDIVGIRIVRTGDIVCILYRGAWKVGFIYEGGSLTPQQVQKVFADVPENYNELDRWETAMNGKVDVLVPMKGNYVFINDEEVKPIKNKENERNKI